jgi:hypothetical protein
MTPLLVLVYLGVGLFFAHLDKHTFSYDEALLRLLHDGYPVRRMLVVVCLWPAIFVLALLTWFARDVL